MFEKFTKWAKRAVSLSQDEAMALGHDHIGTEHVLLGLVGAEGGLAGEVLTQHGVSLSRAREETMRILVAAGVTGTGGQAATDALASIGIDVEAIRRQADATFGPGRFQYPRPPFTPRGKKVLELSLRESVALEHSYIGTEHLLLGMLAEGEGVGIKVLQALDVNVAELRPEILARTTQQ
jgi:ATP-dependent Clp protease ATP-binding subunit ClpA